MENMTPIDLIEHEMFDRFFLEVVNEIREERATAIGKCKNFVGFKRSAFNTLLEHGYFLRSCAESRKKEIYACAQKRSNLSRRERDFLEHLTIRAGAKLIAYLNKPKTE